MPNPPEMQIAEYDNIIVGSSPLNLIVALQKLSNNEKVLLIEENEKLGGAWYTKSIWGYKNMEVGCHILKNKVSGYSILTKNGLKLKTMSPKPSVLIAKPNGVSALNKVLNTFFYLVCKIAGKATIERPFYDFLKSLKHGRQERSEYKYFPNGCFELVKKLELDILKRNGIIKTNCKIKSANVQNSPICVTSSSGEQMTCKKLILTKNFNIENITWNDTTSNPIQRVLIGEHYVLRLNGKKKSPFSFIHVLEDNLINLISDTGAFCEDVPNTELVLCISVKSGNGVKENNLIVNSIESKPTKTEQNQCAEMLLKKLKDFNLISVSTLMIDFIYESYPVNVKDPNAIKELKERKNPNVEFLDSTDLIDSLIQYC